MTSIADERSPRYAGWRVVGACYLAAVFCWGFGLYGHGVYLAELHRLHGWSTTQISSATTAFYLLTAVLVVFISNAIARLGPRRMMLIGGTCFGGAVALLAVITELWQLYAAYLIMAVGAASMHVGSISNVIGLWFDRQRGAGDQPCAQRRELRRHPGDAAAGAGDRALRICQRHAGLGAAVRRGPAAGHRALDRPAGGREGVRARCDARRRAGMDAPARAAQPRRSGASPRRSPWR